MKKEKAIASKTSLNLAMRDRDLAKSPVVVVPLVALIVGLAVLVSLGVGSQLARVGVAQGEVDDVKETIAQLQAGYTDYDEVEAEYNRYTYKDYDRTMADRLDVLALMERDIFPVCSVRDFSVAGRQLSLVAEGLTLESTSALINQLNSEKLVSSVSVSTYDATSDTGTVYPLTNMVIVLADATQPEEVDK